MTESYTPATPLDDVTLPWDTTAPETIAADVRRHAVKLAALRLELHAREDAIRVRRRDFEETLTDQLRALELLRREVDAAEGTVRALALVEHETSGVTKPCPSVSVVVGKEYEIDEAAALSWAKVTRMCLVPETVDTKAIKKMAAVVELPFVTVKEKPSVRIATDLLAALDGAHE